LLFVLKQYVLFSFIQARMCEVTYQISSEL